MVANKVKSMAKGAWWFTVLTGALGILFGLFTMFHPKLTIATLVYAFAIFVVALGAVWLVLSFASMKENRLWWLSLLFAVLCVATGSYLFRNPLTTVELFVILTGIVIIIQALVDLVNASYADDREDRVLWITTGVLGVLLSFAIWFYPTGATLAFVWVLGLYALIRGVVAVVYAFNVKSAVRDLIKETKSTK